MMMCVQDRRMSLTVDSAYVTSYYLVIM